MIKCVLFFQAHPDDESLTSAGVIALMAAAGVRVDLVTATRGEQGKIDWDSAGLSSSSLAGSELTAAVRVAEVAAAAEVLGIRHQVFLGQGIARQPGRPDRRYEDSGMARDAEGNPVLPKSPAAAALTQADPAEVRKDLIAAIRACRPQAVVTHNQHGGYGHPDHRFLHEQLLAAVDELAGEGSGAQEQAGSFEPDHSGDGGAVNPPEVWVIEADPYSPRAPHPDSLKVDWSAVFETKLRALQCYPSQFMVIRPDPSGITAESGGAAAAEHKGGTAARRQRPIRLRVTDGTEYEITGPECFRRLR